MYQIVLLEACGVNVGDRAFLELINQHTRPHVETVTAAGAITFAGSVRSLHVVQLRCFSPTVKRSMGSGLTGHSTRGHQPF